MFLTVLARKNSLKEVVVTPIDDNEGDNYPLCHMTTNKRMFGASDMAYKEKLMEVSEIIGEDIMIMPKSCCDLVVAPKYLSGYDKDGKLLMKDMVNIFKQL